MKKAFILMSLAALFALACDKVEDEKTVIPGAQVVSLSPVPVEGAETFVVGITSTVPVDVVVPSSATWLKYYGMEMTSRATGAYSLVFSVEENEQTEIREAEVTVRDRADGTVLASFTVKQDAAEAMVFEVDPMQPEISAAGGEITLTVLANAPYVAEIEGDAEWLSIVETKAAVESAITLSVDYNEFYTDRTASVRFVHEVKGFELGTVTVTQKANTNYPVLLGDDGYETIAAAIEAAKAMTSGEAVITLTERTFAEDLLLSGLSVPLKLDGRSLAVIDGHIEVGDNPVTIKDITLRCSGEGTKPEITTSYDYPFGIMLHEAGRGTRIENVKIEMDALAEDATGIMLLNESGTAGGEADVISGCTVDGGTSGHRLMQAYGANAVISDNVFKAPYSSYAVRIGQEGGNVTLSGNSFEGESKTAVDFHNSLTGSTITLGDGVDDNNVCGSGYTFLYSSSVDVTASNTFKPALQYNESGELTMIHYLAFERVWGKYASTDTAWYESLGMQCGGNYDRFTAVDDKYVYTSIIKNGNTDNYWGISVIDHEGKYVKTLRAEAGIEKVGLWAASALQVVPDGKGGSVLVACNMSRKAEQCQLRIYAWKDINSAPQVVSYSYLDAHPNSRLGDKMGFSGNMQSGELYFVDYFSGSKRAMLIFKMESGAISSTPVDTQFDNILSGASNMATLAYAGGSEYLYYGTSAATDFACGLVERSGNSFSTMKYALSPSKGFDRIMNGVKFLEAKGQKYLIWLTHDQASADRTGYVKVLKLSGETFAEGLKNLTAEAIAAAEVYPVAHATDLTVKAVDGRNGNHTGDLGLYVSGDNIWLSVCATGSGMSLFKLAAH